MAVIANRLLSRMAAEWQRAGVGVVGVLAEDNDTEGTCSAGFLRDIASGKAYSIQLDASPAGTSCHLDAAGVEDASAALLDQIASADIVILSKFGKLEAMHKGLWPALSAALAAGKPLLTTVSPRHAATLKAIVPEALWLEADDRAVEHWWRRTMPASPPGPSR
jgi:nucleoside-triphosphatase THEP1